jgi:hypothetical protein
MAQQDAAGNAGVPQSFHLRARGPASLGSVFAVKRVLVALLVFGTVSCSTGIGTQPSGAGATASSPRKRGAVPLPDLVVAGVVPDHSLTREEVAAVSSAYIERFVSGCGLADAPVDRGASWSVQLWGGYAGSDYGRLQISKDGRRVSLWPPRRGLSSTTKALLTRYGVSYE